MTVYESLIFSARLRLPAGQTDEKVRVKMLQMPVPCSAARHKIPGNPSLATDARVFGKGACQCLRLTWHVTRETL